MTTKQETKPSQTPKASAPSEVVAVFQKDHYGPFGRWRTGQRITRKRAGACWDAWVRDGLVRVL